MEIITEGLDLPPLRRQAIEIVERKGGGHPDTICDDLAEAVSRALCRYYLDAFGRVLHHNVDKLLLRGGEALPRYGGGEVTAPIDIYLAGRATARFRGVEVPVEALAAEACRSWLGSHFHALDPDRHVRCHCLIRQGSADLIELFGRRDPKTSPLANDTSCGVGFAPMTPTERATLNADRALHGPDMAKAYPALGEDTKVMAVRRGQSLAMTVACAQVSQYVPSLDDYLSNRAVAAKLARVGVETATDMEAAIEVNAADEPARDSVYLTVTGTSAEAGDDGEVGRGNRANGLITPFRPMTIEAMAGKNPISHVGKLYSALACDLANAIEKRFPDVGDISCFIVSRIGAPVDEPQVLHVRMAREKAGPLPVAEIDRMAREHLADLGRLSQRLIEGTWEGGGSDGA